MKEIELEKEEIPDFAMAHSFATSLYYFRDKRDIKDLIEMAKIIDDKLGINCESMFKKIIRAEYSENSEYINFDCTESGFHIWNFEEPVFTVDTNKDIEVIFKCANCETFIVLRGTTKLSKGD